MAELTLAELLLKLIAEWRSITRPRQRDLLRLCNNKYAQLEKTHDLFVGLLRDAQRIIEHKLGHMATNEDFRDLFRDLEDRRAAGRQARLSHYQQARFYADEFVADRSGILKTVPAPIVKATKEMMRSYVEYFNYEGGYEHEISRFFYRLRNRLEKVDADRRTLAEARQELLENIRTSTMYLEMAWITFSRDYYRAYATFADHGILAEDIGKGEPPATNKT